MTANGHPRTDYLILADYVLSSYGWLQPGYVTVSGDKISAVSGGVPDEEQYAQAGEVIRARGMALMPGLLNGHTHFSQTFMRGLAGGRPLLSWLKELIWPLQSALTVDDLHLAALLGLVENMRCGVTYVVNHHKVTSSRAHTETVLSAIASSGMRATLARAWSDRGANAENPDAIAAELKEGFEQYANTHPFIRYASGPLTPWRCSAKMLQKTHQLARDFDSVTHIHVSETQDEVKMTLQETGMRPVAWLDHLGVLDEHIQVVHAVWTDVQELDLLAQRKSTVVHCPVSNAVMGSGIAPISEMLARRIPLYLGTDGPASNDTQDLFETAKATIMLARARMCDASIMSPASILDLALNGNRLAVGTPADLILVNLDHTRAAPVHDIDSALMLSTHGSDIDSVMVAGRFLLRNGQVTVLDEQALLEACRHALINLRRRAGL
jgi:5-methylthioadenosine/S-adenosylhomocysteine deaminase